MTANKLTKPQYLAGLQCSLRLWYERSSPDLASPPDAASQLRSSEGETIGRHARSLFPDGLLVEASAWSEALERTGQLLDDVATGAIFEAAFEHEGLRIRTDVLERTPTGWLLHEVKSATRVRGDHLDDVAFQLAVLDENGIVPEHVTLLHLDADYVRGDAVDWPHLFRSSDVTDRARDRVGDVRKDLERLRPVIESRDADSDAPRVEPSEHCRRPRWCRFYEHCTRSKPHDWIGRFPGLTGARLVWLQEQGVERVSELPPELELSEIQQRAARALATGREVIAPELEAVLEDLGPPTLYLDFETWGPAIPRFAGTRPFQQVPFQWSLHEQAKDGAVTQREFLAPAGADPRRAFAESLLAALGDAPTPVLVYSAFEAERLAELARDLPDLAAGLQAVRGRLRDLLAIVRNHVYHPDFRGSFSLKRVAPTLTPGFGYGDLGEVAGGDQAVVALERLWRGELDPAADAELRQALLEYCARDTLALVELHTALRGRALGGPARLS